MKRITSALSCLCFSLALFALSFSLPAVAVEQPKPSTADSRVRTVMYDPNNVVLITGYHAYTTTVFFAEGEEIELIPSETGEDFNPIIVGDEGAWSAKWFNNALVLKPIAERGKNGDTNLFIRTNRRTYSFLLKLGANEGIAKSSEAKDMMFQVRFMYPSDINNSSGPEAALERNYRYHAKGRPDDFPNETYDDGTHMYMRFGKYQGTPSVFAVDRNGMEHIVEWHMAPKNLLVVHGVHMQLRLRVGGSVVCIFRDDKLSRYIYSPESGTANPELLRERK